MLKFFLVRHGQNQDNAEGILNGHRDRPLTQIGIDQAHELADKLLASSVHFDSVYSSPLQRAYETANIITAKLSLPEAEILPNLIERDFGVMTGVSQTEIVERCAPDIMQTETITYFLNPEGAETFPQLVERAKTLLQELQGRHHDGNILLVTHGDFGKMIYAAYYKLDWPSVLQQFHFGNSEMLELSEESSHEDAHVHTIKQFNV